jgi:hypothetical protein
MVVALAVAMGNGGGWDLAMAVAGWCWHFPLCAVGWCRHHPVLWVGVVLGRGTGLVAPSSSEALVQSLYGGGAVRLPKWKCCSWHSMVIQVAFLIASPVSAGMAGFFKRQVKALPGILLLVLTVSTLSECHFPCWRYYCAAS